MRPYLATPPDFLRQRLEELESLKMSLHVEIKSGILRTYGPQAKDRRLLDVADFIEGFANHLPDMVVHMSGHDSGSQIFGEDFRREISRVLDAQTCECEASDNANTRYAHTNSFSAFASQHISL